MTSKNTELSSALRFGFQTSNNEAEYKTLLAGLKRIKKIKTEKLKIFSDLTIDCEPCYI